MSRRVPLALCSILSGALFLAACGGSSSSAGPATARGWLDSATQAIDTAGSARVTAHLRQGPETATVDVVSFSDGATSGSMVILGQKADVVATPSGVAYLKGSAGFWSAFAKAAGSSLPAQATTLLSGRWISFPASSSDSLVRGFSLKGVLQAVSAKKDKVAEVGTREISGAKAVGVSGVEKSTVWVSSSSPHYPVLVTPANASAGNSITFSDWGEGTRPTVPKGAVSMQQLLQG